MNKYLLCKALQIIALTDDALSEKLVASREKMREDVLKKDKELQEKI